ncbi:MAG: methyltransferase [Planctomycetes bacterium]|nr:methyltransferase [Planctomycetota bacterium]
MRESDLTALVERHTRPGSPAVCPEIRTLEAEELVPIWEDAERIAGREVEPPFWAYSWPGSQALARHLLDHPEVVRARTVLDLGCGNGLAGLAAARAGAKRVLLNDIDPAALWMASRNARENGLRVDLSAGDLLGAEPPVPPVEVVLAGDLFYARAMSGRVEPWVRAAAALGAMVLVGDPGRAYLPRSGLRLLASYEVPVPPEIESVAARRAAVLILE